MIEQWRNAVRVVSWICLMVVIGGLVYRPIQPIAISLCVGAGISVVNSYVLARWLHRWFQRRTNSIGWGVRLAVTLLIVALVQRSGLVVEWLAVCFGILLMPVVLMVLDWRQMQRNPESSK